MYKDEYLKNKTKFYGNVNKTGFNADEILPEKSLCMVNTIILIHFLKTQKKTIKRFINKI